MTVNIPIHPSIPNYPSNLSAQHGGIHCNITVKFKLYPPIHTCICMYVCTWYASFFFRRSKWIAGELKGKPYKS